MPFSELKAVFFPREQPEESLEPATEVGPGHPSVALLAARVGPARLIDNAPLPG